MKKWIKKGFIYNVDERAPFAKHAVLGPNPFLLNEEVIRVYGGFRDEQGRSRIGFVDVEAANPSHIINVSPTPALDLGEKGMFDDNGVILGDVIRVSDKIYMYYVGFQHVQNAKFMACSGLAISTDGGNTFKRIKPTPIADRVPNAVFGRCIHSVLFDEGVFKIYYSVIYGWEYINGIPYPQYDIRYVESKDGIHITDDDGIHCIGCQGNEYRIGRPRVIKRDPNQYEMRYTFDTRNKEYISGIAYSTDGIHWTRKDEESGLEKSETGWDSEMTCYPVEIETKYGTYLFYDGNGMGAAGFGYAELEK